ncbi:TVP38/TMEM64 family protein [Bacillaceae bacterium S4-13-58]
MNRRAVVVLIILLIIASLMYLNQTVLNLSPQLLKEWFLSFGRYAPALFISAYIVRPMILFPASVLSITSGLVFGAVVGTVYTVIGATLGAVLSFLIARKLGDEFVKRKYSVKWDGVQRKMENNGLLYILFLRLIPIFNFDLISYLSGLTRIKLSPFFIATLVGIIPGTYAYNFLGSSFVSGSWQQIVVAIVVFGFIVGLTMIIKGKVTKTVVKESES